MTSSAADERGDSPDGRNQTEGSNDQASTDGRAFQVRFVASLLGWSHHCEQVASEHGSAKREYEPSKQLVTEEHRCPVNQQPHLQPRSLQRSAHDHRKATTTAKRRSLGASIAVGAVAG